MKHPSKTVFTTLVLIAALLFSATTVFAASVTPSFVAGNPTCTGLGYDFGYRIDPPNAGTYILDGINSVTVTTADSVYFDWTSTLGIDAVISKGGNGANVYVYDPPAESFGDTGLHSPINPQNDMPYGLSHIDFCFDYELTASKTANAQYTRTYTWDITKSVSPEAHTGFTGDSFTSNYEVVVDQTVNDSNFAVTGTITVNNPSPFPVNFSVSDSVNGNPATVSCPANIVAPGGSVVCSYNVGLASKTDGTNTATITSNTSGVDGASASANYAFGTPTTIVGEPTVNINDSMEGALGEVSGDQTFQYSNTFTCDGDEGQHDNIATIEETGQTADASVTVACYELQVTKDADTSFTRTWDWTIDKSADQTDLLLSNGQLFQVNYEVAVSASFADSDHAVSGGISVYNPAPINAVLLSVNDVISPNIPATVDCGVTFPYILAAGGTLNCTYSADLPDAASRTNTATATLQNTPSGTTHFTGSANVSFASADMNEVDECIDVSDTNVGVLGTVCADDAPKTFTYSLWFGANPDADVVLECGENTHINTASFVTNDTGSTGSDSWTVNADVSCLLGCTLTQGYWKTHSALGPAPYDDAWKNLSIFEHNTLFFLSGKTWYQVFWTAPAGNPYYNLAHQYMAAKLNILNGAATTPAVVSAISNAENFFWTTLPSTKLSNAKRANVLAWAATLDNYNNGLIGPGHCDE